MSYNRESDGERSWPQADEKMVILPSLKQWRDLGSGVPFDQVFKRPRNPEQSKKPRPTDPRRIV